MAIDTDHVLLEKDGDVARVWLNRPHKKNAVTFQKDIDAFVQ